MPAEIVDYELMREMAWSWTEMERTPPYVRKFCTDLMVIRRRCEAERAKRK